MATIAEIERIAALVEQLLPLRDRRRGELIQADDWNTVVGALLEVARAVVTDADEAVPPHTHSDQVTAAWLDPTLRARIEKGPLAEPAAVARVSKLERSFDGLRVNLDAVKGDLTGIRTAANRLEATDLARESTLTRVTRKVDGLADGRDDVSEVRTTLGVLQTDLDRVSTFARDLEVGGETISVASLVDRIAQVEGLRDRLTGPDGDELNATTFRLRLAELENTLVTEEELNVAIGGLGGGTLPDGVRDQLFADARLVAREQAAATANDLEGRLTSDITTRLATVEQAATAAAAARAEEIGGQVEERLRADLEREIRAGDDAVRGTLDDALSGAQTNIRNDVDARFEALRTDVDASISGGLGEARQDLMAGVDRAIADLQSQVEPLAAQITAAERASANATARADSVARQLDGSVAELTDLVEKRLAGAVATVREDALAADSKLVAGLRAEMAAERQRVDRAIEGIASQLPRIVDERITIARRELDARFETQFTRVREELGATIAGSIGREVDARIVSGGLIPRDRIGGPVTDFERPR